MIERFLSAVAGLLNWLYSLTHSYGIAIILLTILVMILITPLNLKSTRSMLEMQRLQPELRRIQAEFKDDRERQQQEMMAFYKEHNINPLGGCLPMLAQAPVFLILYQVLRGITERTGGFGGGIGHVVGQMRAGVTPTAWRLADQPFRPKHLGVSDELYRSLSSTNKMNFFKVDLAISPADALRAGIITAIPFMLLMVAMLVSQIIQNRQIQGRNTGTEMPAQQQMMMKVLPFMLPVFSFALPAGLGLYYFVQGLCRIGLQGYITRRFYGEGGLGHQAAEARKAADAKKAAEKKTGDAKKSGDTKDAVVETTASVKGSQKAGAKRAGGNSGADTASTPSAKSGTAKSGTAKSGTAKSGSSKPAPSNGASKSRASKESDSAGTAGQSAGQRSSAKSAAVQRKNSGSSSPQRGRRSGAPRTGSGRG